MRISARVILILVIGTCLGCGGGTDQYRGPFGRVSGTVTFNDQPVPVGSTVSFIAQQGNFTATAQTDASGQYQLAWQGSSDIPVGTYIVAITSGGGDVSEGDYEKMMQLSAEGKLAETSSGIPSTYANPSSSGLTFTVSEGDNKFDIPLK